MAKYEQNSLPVYSSKQTIFNSKKVTGFVFENHNLKSHEFAKTYQTEIEGNQYQPIGIDVLNDGRAVVILKALDNKVDVSSRVVAHCTTITRIGKLAQMADVDESLFKLKKFAFVALVTPDKKKPEVKQPAQSLKDDELPPMTPEMEKLLAKMEIELPEELQVIETEEPDGYNDDTVGNKKK